MSQIIHRTTAGQIGAIIEIAGDTGVAIPVAGIVNVYAHNAVNNSGSSVLFAASGNSDILNVTDASFNTLIGNLAGNLTLSGALNTGLGYEVLHGLTSGSSSVAIGNSAMFSATSANECVAIGSSSLDGLLTGSNVIAIGYLSGSALVGAESNDILIGSIGVAAESATTRIGTNGTQTACYIAGIAGVNVGSVATVVSEAGDKLGTTVITAGTGISVTPGANTITIAATGTTNLTYTNVNTSPYVVLSTDEYLSVDCSSIPITIELPNAATSGRVFIIKDRTGNAAVNNITVESVSGLIDIDGSTTFVMNNDYESIEVIGNNSSYEVF